MSTLTSFLDAHGTTIRVLACAVVLFSFAFVAVSVLIERRQRQAKERFHIKFIRPAELRVERKGRMS